MELAASGGESAAPFELVVFDLDGTLVDSAPDIAWALNQTLREVGVRTFTVDEVRAMVGDGAAQLVARALAAAAGMRSGAAAVATLPLVARFVAHYEAHLVVDSALYPGIGPLLDAAGRRGSRLAVLTNKPGHLARALLADLGVAGHFARIIGDGDGFPRKPDPAAAHDLAAHLLGSPGPDGQGPPAGRGHRVVVVGDGLPDVRMARAIPCPSIAVTWGYTSEAELRAESPHAVATSVAELERQLLGGGR